MEEIGVCVCVHVYMCVCVSGWGLCRGFHTQLDEGPETP